MLKYMVNLTVHIVFAQSVKINLKNITKNVVTNVVNQV